MNIKPTLPTTRIKITSAQFAIISLIGAAAVLFLELSGDVWLNEGFSWDAPIMLWLHQWHTPWLDGLFTAITQSAGGWIVAPLFMAGVVLWQRDEKKTAVTLLASFAGSTAINALLKLLFARPRPNVFPPITVETSFSFPSGHTMAAIALYGLAAILLWQRQRYGWTVLAGLWVLLVALSRIYLGVHYPSDVLASLAVGTIWLILVMFSFACTAS
ncbi:MAG: phosphatase PAP2 family protein [Ardenticatenaceae bacterium]|nr:phosphatase PAP2 family protein [Ardenticatenaceae bacterium]MCB8989846.1 phosphatase PAP2 family protein [Ardenticatenaceae bacterium]